jgi:hypothetical protein
LHSPCAKTKKETRKNKMISKNKNKTKQRKQEQTKQSKQKK